MGITLRGSATIQSSTGDASASLCNPEHVHDMQDGGYSADLKSVLGRLFVERDLLCEGGISTRVVHGLGPESLIVQLDSITDNRLPVEIVVKTWQTVGREDHARTHLQD